MLSVCLLWEMPVPPFTNYLLPMTNLQWGFGFLNQKVVFFTSVSTSQMCPSCLSQKCHNWLWKIWNASVFVRKQFPVGKTQRAPVPAVQLNKWKYVNVFVYKHTFMPVCTRAFSQFCMAEKCSKCGSGNSTVKISLPHQCQNQSAWTKPADTLL